VISQYWGEGHFYLVVEGLTRLAEAVHDDPSFFADGLVYVHTIDANRARPFLEVIGFRHVVSGNILVTKKLLSPRPTPCGGHIKSRHAVLLRNLIPLVRGVSNTILVVRRFGSREIVNHDALVSALSGQVRVHTGQETMLQQLQMFADARIVIAPHGAGLANIVAMQKDSAVVEIQVAPANYCYMFWAYNLGLRYYMQYEQGALHHGKFHVDIPSLLAIPVF